MAEGPGVESPVEEGGAVVESGKSEAGGGSEISASGAGKGACEEHTAPRGEKQEGANTVIHFILMLHGLQL